MKKPNKHYRYIYKLNDSFNTFRFNVAVDIVLLTFDTAKETSKGYWLTHEGDTEKYKWVSKYSKKRFAYPTKREALNSLFHRTVMRKGFLQNNIKLIDSALPKISDLLKEMNDEKA